MSRLRNLPICPRRRDPQRGFVLIAALIFMIVLTLLQLGLANSTTSEEKMARNFRDSSISFQSAEAALRDAELHVSGAYQWPYAILNSNAFTAVCTNGLCDSTGTVLRLDNLDFYGTTGLGANSVPIGTITGSPAILGLSTANQPRYMIETICTVLGSLSGGGSCNKVYRITAQARGRFPNTRVTLQAIYVPPDLAN